MPISSTPENSHPLHTTPHHEMRGTRQTCQHYATHATAPPRRRTNHSPKQNESTHPNACPYQTATTKEARQSINSVDGSGSSERLRITYITTDFWFVHDLNRTFL